MIRVRATTSLFNMKTCCQCETSSLDDTVQARLKLATECITTNIASFELRAKDATSETERAWAGGVVAGLKIAEKYVDVVKGGAQ